MRRVTPNWRNAEGNAVGNERRPAAARLVTVLRREIGHQISAPMYDISSMPQRRRHGERGLGVHATGALEGRASARWRGGGSWVAGRYGERGERVSSRGIVA